MSNNVTDESSLEKKPGLIKNGYNDRKEVYKRSSTTGNVSVHVDHVPSTFQNDKKMCLGVKRGTSLD